MRSSACLTLMFALVIFGAPSVSATDYWDLAADPDNGIGTDNEMSHGTSQLHDLQAQAAVADQDWYAVIGYARSSFEAVVDSMSGDLDMFNPPSNVQRLAIDGTTVLQTSEEENVGAPVGGVNRALRWEMGGTTDHQFLRVQSSVCGVSCGNEDQYRIRFRDTTVAIPRFNNASGQVTVLLVQNTTEWTRNINGSVYFWSSTGTLLGSTTFSLAAKAALVLNTTTVPGVAGQGGTLTIAHDGGYGNLATKAVALEPATGFSFDSPGLYKPQ